ncbi:hypothetical protein [uncultured Rikenella sp.]|uniref:phage upper tail fiber protein n=1 Tax=uncultured Rikenella sp. TaxID=368003 RepID=UPI0025F16A57|nr:hypothetical protein [uncultured Rikenella sp.]
MTIFYKPTQGDTAATVAEGYDRNFRELDEEKETLSGAQEKADAAQNAAVREAAIKAEAALRNAKEYTDAREVAILASADSKDADTLQRAKTYADQIVAALAGSAPETLDTLQELAAALGDDPNFAATVMQLIGDRVKTSDFTAHTDDTERHITTAERSAWNAKLNAGDYTAADVRAKLLTVDGPGSGLDADLWDGVQLWRGTKAQYAALSAKDANTLYIVTD